DNIIKHPEIFEQLKADGHAIGNHTFNHLKGWKTDDDIYVSNFLKCQELTQTDLFRPPYGRIKKSQIEKVSNEYQITRSKKQDDLQSSHISHLISHISIVMWDVLSGDFDPSLSPEKCLQNVLRHTENGSVVVFHDSLKAWDRLEFVLPRVLETWRNEGFTFGVL
ncbi:MAG TPA: polysaccharide deacetylase family protein, partial [Pelobium sp.]|nr:polysaccharide deacetylase family protein [Pelobium sp.]